MCYTFLQLVYSCSSFNRSTCIIEGIGTTVIETMDKVLG